MGRVKKNIKRIWNSRCKYLVIVACALILANGVNFLQAGLKFINSDGVEQEEKKSVVITSSTWESKEPGSFQVTKSAEWTDIRKATIKFQVETNGKTGHTERDIILVLDNSGSMGTKVNGKQKLGQLQSDTTELINFLLTEEGTRIAVISFNGSANLLSDFTNDKSKLTSVVNNLKATGGTSYKNAYQAVINLLSGYEEAKDRDLVMLFLTDGGAPAASAEYSILKGKYNIHICGIQYELGNKIKQPIIESSDVQYAANTINLKSIFFESIGVESYEEFEITDYITKEFVVEDISDIRVSRGEVKIETDSSGKQKVIWKISTSDVKFITSFSATMEIDVIYKGELEPDRVIKTNEKEEIKVKLPEPAPGPEEIESEEVPGIRGGYYVTYDPNLPSECNPDGKDMTVKRAYFPYEVVDRNLGNYTCLGWQIKEWKIDGTVPDLGGDKFTMPLKDVKITAIWTKIDIDKKMEGTISDVYKQSLVEAMIENVGTSVSVDTSINFGAPSSETNGRGLYVRNGTENDTNPIYYYRGAVENNHVLFAGICWQIVRTTEGGGIKLIYNGVSSDGKTCNSTGETYIGISPFSKKKSGGSFGLVGYMQEPFNVSCGMIDSKHKWGRDVSYDSSKYRYTLTSPTTTTTKTPEAGYHYTCSSTGTSCQGSVNYFYYITDGGSSACWFYISNAQRIDSKVQSAFNNTSSSAIKTTIDNWYKEAVDDKGYTKYLEEDVVWCNDRTITSGSLYSASSAYATTIFAANGMRNLNSTSASPAVKEDEACSNIRDRFTSKNANTGNKVLTYPVGMLTADEVILSGMGYGTTTASHDSYLSTDYNYWTMTPHTFGDKSYSYDYNFSVNENGYLIKASVGAQYYIRPSISLKPGTLVYGIGTKDDPYEVVTE